MAGTVSNKKSHWCRLSKADRLVKTKVS